MPPRPSAPCVRVATASEQAAALGLALRALPAENRGPLLDSVGRIQQNRLGALDALVVLLERGAVQAAAWAQPSSGGVAALWPAEWRGRRPRNAPEAEAALIRAAVAVCDACGVTLIQALFENESDPRFAGIEASGFRRIATLEYLGRSLPSSPDSSPDHRTPATGRLRFEPVGDSHYERLKRVVERTYVDSLDCPGLGQARRVDDVLTGYRSTGRYDPRNWLIASDGEADAGVVILAEHPDSDQAELIYMGLVPEARGKGLGRELVSEAIRVAGVLGVDHLMVAVDRENTPAKRVYETAGFVPWTQRVVYVRTEADR